MESGPSKIAEGIVYWLLPPACREEVIGDMRERNDGPARFLLEATHTIPSVVYSRIRRTTDVVVAMMEALSVYTALVMAARWLNPELLFRDYGFARLAIPTAVFLSAIILADAYSDPKRHTPLKALFGPILGFALAYALQLKHGLALPAAVLAWGGACGALIVSTLRLIYPPFTERPQEAKMPVFWQKLELLPPPFSLRMVLVPCLLFAAIVLYLLMGSW